MATTTTASDSVEPKKIWKAATHSSGPLGIADGVVYAPLAQDGKHYAALDVATGELRWKAPSHGNLPPRFAPAVTDRAVIVQRYSPTRPKVLVVLDRESGQVLRDMRCAGSSPADLDESSALVHGPFRIGPLVVCVTYGPLAPALREANRHAEPPPRARVTAMDPSTGATVYEVELPTGMVPHTVVGDGERIIVGGRQTVSGTSDEHQAWQGRIIALRGSDGGIAWESEPGPALVAGGHGIVLADLRPSRSRVQHTAAGDEAPNELLGLDAATGSVRFRREMRTGWTAFVAEDRVLCVEPHTDGAMALDLATGKELWSTPAPHGADPPARPTSIHARSFAACGGRVWLTGSRGRVIGFDLAEGTFHPTKLRGYTLASDGERLFVGDAASLTAFRV